MPTPTPSLYRVIDPRTGRTVEVWAVSKGAAKREGSRELTLLADAFEPAVLAREVLALRVRDAASVAA